MTAPLRRALLALVVFSLALTSAHAVSTDEWERHGRTFRVGTLEGMLVSPDGLLMPGPARRTLPAPEGAVVWDALLVGEHVVVAASEGRGLLVHPAGGGEARKIVSPDARDVMALAVDAKGRVYAATGPGGAVYRVELAEGRFEELYRPEARYVWSIVPMDGGALALATGLPGEVLRLDPKRKSAERLWRVADAHVRSLVFAGGRLVAGTAGSGWLVELDAKKETPGFVLWDSKRPEVVALAAEADGTIWAAFSGAPGKAESGGTGERTRKEEPKAEAATTITVRASAEGSGSSTAAGGQAEQKKAKAPRLPAGGGALVRLAPGEQPVEVWKDKRETPLDLDVVDGLGLLMAVGNPARIWWLDHEGRDGWWDESPQSKAISALASDGERVLAAASNPAGLRLYGGTPEKAVRWTSDVLDTGSHTRFGHVQAVVPERSAAAVRVFARAGNTSEPGFGWTAWTAVEGAASGPRADGARAELPAARFLQIKVEAEGAASRAFGISRVSARYRGVNRPPRVESVHAEPVGVAYRPLPPAAMTSGEMPVVPAPRSTAVRRAVGGKSTAWRSKKVFEAGALTLTWSAADPDADTLSYRLELCADDGGGCDTWRELARGLKREFYSFDSRTLEDGVYRFRVVASDAGDNAAGEGREGRAESAPVRVDHTAPEIAEFAVSHDAGAITVRVVARDAGGRLVRAEAAVDSGPWKPLAAADGVIDSATETFGARIRSEAPPRSVSIRVADEAGNVTTRRSAPE